ncbi:MAG: hypothetical protein QME46_10030 [Thermoanaerobacteraceae bacterium]|nr:hypothetical protein [Thermoanaerobacteraceae bacterium]
MDKKRKSRAEKTDRHNYAVDIDSNKEDIFGIISNVDDTFSSSKSFYENEDEKKPAT